MKKCQLCELSHSCTQEVLPESHPEIQAIGEAPGADEDMAGQGFVGMAGKNLDRIFLAAGRSRSDYGRANICRCRPPENRKPRKVEVEACIPKLAKFIEETRPKVIVAIGGTPVNVMLGSGPLYEHIEDGRNHGHEAIKIAGACHSALKPVIMEYNPYIVPCVHSSPLALNRNAPDGTKWRMVAEQQIRSACALLRT